MPHECTNCSHIFADGSKEMLSGCPDCGGHKFQFRPPDQQHPSVTNTAKQPDSQHTDQSRSSQTHTDSSSHDSSPRTQRENASRSISAESEDVAQADARSDVVSVDELQAASRHIPNSAENGEIYPERSSDKGQNSRENSEPDTDLIGLRNELNQQFESIKIVAPGEYEINLMELYDRSEYIISLQEDGRYVINVPGSS
jgi:predicted  nucleic acid-binding Zn-ribbon protein